MGFAGFFLCRQLTNRGKNEIIGKSSDAEICIEVKDPANREKHLPAGEVSFVLRLFGCGIFCYGRNSNMETRVAVISIIVENPTSVEALNDLLHQYGQYIIGRMGIPYREKGINIISVAMDAPQDIISALSGKIGKLTGVSAKAAYSNVVGK